MKKFIKKISTIIIASTLVKGQTFPVDLGYGKSKSDEFPGTGKGKNNENHYEKKKLKNISFNCEDYYLYPVFIEDFNYLSDVEQNFQFWLGYTVNDNVRSDENFCNEGNKTMPVTYYGNNSFAKQNGNVRCENGKLILERKRQDIVINNYSSQHNCVHQNDFPYTYKFTNSILKSLFKVRKGIVEGSIKFPEFPYVLSAFWLYAGEPTRQEIDIVEYIPNNLMTLDGPCLLDMAPYCYYNFTIHNEQIFPNYTDHHERAAKFLPHNPDDFLNVDHKYTLYWDDYKVDLYLDDEHKVRGRKYADGSDKDQT